MAPADAKLRGRTLLGVTRFAYQNAKSRNSDFNELWGS